MSESNQTFYVRDHQYRSDLVSWLKTNGWIESKFISKWPPRNKPVNLRKFIHNQRRWIAKRHEAGGHCYIMLLVGKDKSTREFLLFPGSYAMKLGHVTRRELYKNCVWHGNDRDIEYTDIMAVLTS